MTAVLRHESRSMVRGAVLMSGLIGVTAAFMLVVFPSMQAEAEAFEEIFPEYLMALMGLEELHTLEGFASGYIYPFLLIVLVGAYVAYLGAGMINADIRDRRMDLLLANPITRESIVIQKIAALWVPIMLINGILFMILIVGAAVLDEVVSLRWLLTVHLFAVPYLMVCGAIGLVCSVFLSREETAQAAAIGIVMILWLLQGVAEMQSDYENLRWITPSNYYDSSAILLHQDLAIGDALILLAGFGVLASIAIIRFVRRDI